MNIKRYRQAVKRPWVIVTVTLVIIVLAVFFSVNEIMSAFLHSRPEVVVPKIENRSLVDALMDVSPLDLSLQLESIDYDDKLPAGTIVRQHPQGGMKVRAGRVIRVIVSKGGQMAQVPSLMGKDLNQVQTILATHGLQLGAVSDDVSDTVERGLVASQDPRAGSLASRGALVDVVLSKGPAVAETSTGFVPLAEPQP